MASTGLKMRSVENIIELFYGDLKRWPIEPDGINFTQSQIWAIAEHISKTGDCLWHATATVCGFLDRCHCAKCMPGPGPINTRNLSDLKKH